jgi:hypothetical protein
MRKALDDARTQFKGKWKIQSEAEIRILVQQPSHTPMLQVIDYILWSVNRAFEKEDSRYYRFMLDKISLVHDIFDFERYPNIYYTPKHPYRPIKKSPTEG